MTDVNILAQTFQVTVGGAVRDNAERIIQTADGGYTAVGTSDSFGAGDDDIVLTRLDANGVEQWTRRYGGSSDESGFDVQEVDRDGDGMLDGYAIVGSTTSTDPGNGSSDIYLILTDLMGNISATRTYGGPRNEEGYSVMQMADYGYLICGMTSSYGRPYASITSVIVGNVFVVRTDISLNPDWATVVSSNELAADRGYSAIETLAGDIVLAGTLGEFGFGGKDIAVVALDQNGALLWSHFYGSSKGDEGNEIREVIDGQGMSTGFIVAGTVEGLGTGGDDATLLRLDGSGTLLWHSIFGGTSSDEGHSVEFTASGGFALCGVTRSFGFGAPDVYVVEADAGGAYVQSFVYGGVGTDEGRSIRATADGGYIIGGHTFSFGAGLEDFYFIKTNSNFNSYCNQQAVESDFNSSTDSRARTAPWAIIHMNCLDENNNEATVVLTEEQLCELCGCEPEPKGFQHAYGAGGKEQGFNISEMSTTELLLAGITDSYSIGNTDMYVTKTDPIGNLVWSQAIWPNNAQNATDENAIAALEMPNGNIFVAGTTDNGVNREAYVVVLGPLGVPVGISYTFNPLPGVSSTEGVDAQPIIDNMGNVTGFIVLAELTNYNAGPDPYLLYFDATGTFLNGVILDQTTMNSYEPMAISPIDNNSDGFKDNGWVIAGLVNDAGLNAAVVIETTTAGTPNWQNTYQFTQPNTYPFGFDIVQIDSDFDGQQDDDYALTGLVQTASGSIEAFITRIDQTGAPIAGMAAYFGFTGVDVDSWAITQTCDYDLVVTGEYGSVIYQLRTDVFLNVLCTTGYATNGRGYELLQTADRGIAIVGVELNPATASNDAYLVKTNCECSSGCNEGPLSITRTKDDMSPLPFALTDVANNTSVSVVSFNASNTDETPICAAPLIMLPEESTPVNEFMEMLPQLDYIEQVGSGSTTDAGEFPSSGSMLEIFPNPVQNGSELNVTFSSRNATRVLVKVTNVLGAVVGEYPMNAVPGEQSLQLDTQAWAPGTYTLTVNTADGTVGSSIVVVVR